MKRKKTESLFQDKLPQDIVDELTPEVRRQYFLWDEIMKREIELYPWLILPVIKEIFHKKYSADREIVLLSTEYTVSRIHEKGEKLLHAIRSDLLLKVERDLYHFECQIEKDGKMVFRMLEYDVHIALTHGKTVKKNKNQAEEFAISFPRSAVLYLGDEGNVPEYESCIIHFQDGTSHLYQVPVMRVQDYSLKTVEKKHLNLLVPFLSIRFREQIKNISEISQENILQRKELRERLKRELTEFLAECIMILNHEKEKGILPESAQKDIVEFLWKACGYLLEGDTELYGEVSVEVEPAIKLSREIIQELRENIEELQENNRELQSSNKILYQELENGYKKLIDKLKSEEKSIEETEDILMEIFSLTKEEAREKVRLYRMEK